MSFDQIQAEVSELKSQADENPLLSDADRESLAELAARLELMISGKLDHPEQDLVDKLEAKLFEYEEAHPVIARILDNVLVVLNGMGV